MPSSKFNKRPVPRRKPSICIAPPGSCWPPYDVRRPPQLAGYVHWVDLDPGKEAVAFTLISTAPRTAGGEYYGFKILANSRIDVLIHDQWPTPTVHVLLWLLDPWRPPEPHYWLDVPMPLDKPLETHLLTTIYIPGSDFRIARFTG